MYRSKPFLRNRQQYKNSISVWPSLATVILSTSLASSLYAAPLKPVAKKAMPGKAAHLAPRLYDFKGVPLEISLDEFRGRPHPDGETARVVCTGDKLIENGQPALLSDLAISKAEAAIGIKKCAWWGNPYAELDKLFGRKAPWRSDGTMALKLPVEGYIIGVYTFDFIPDPRDGKMRFYRFFGTSNSKANGDVVEALSAKFGTPRTEVESMQNGLGARFDSATTQWANSLAILTVKERWTEVNKMAIMVTSNRLLKIVADADQKRKAETKNAI